MIKRKRHPSLVEQVLAMKRRRNVPAAHAAVVVGCFLAWCASPARGRDRWERYQAKRFEEQAQRGAP